MTVTPPRHAGGMGYRGLVAEQNRARDLRAEAWTLQAIADELGVAKSSVSLWVRDVEFVPKLRHQCFLVQYAIVSFTGFAQQVEAQRLLACEAGVSIKPGAQAPGPEPIKGKAHEMGGSLRVKAGLS